MAILISKKQKKNNKKFKPRLNNFEVSLSYEGLSLKKASQNKSIDELKHQYAR